MWAPDLHLQPSLAYTFLLVTLHALVCAVLVNLSGLAWLMVPVVALALVFNSMKYGLLKLPRSIKRIWLTEDGWMILLNNNSQQGPFQLHNASRLDNLFVRLSFHSSGWRPKHILLARGMLDKETFRRLQVYLRWAPDVNAIGENG